MARLRERLREARPAADARFRPQSHGPRSPLGGGASRVLRPGHRTRPRPRAAELHLGQAQRTAICCSPTGAIRISRAGPTRCSSTTRNPATQEAMIAELVKIAGQCDGVRCDMAMLVLPEVFERTWGLRAQLFWPRRPRACASRRPGFCFMAEVYWDLEWTLQQQGFDYAYDKRLYDRLRDGHARPVREHFHAGLDYQNKLARFLENHDEPRAAATFPPGRSRGRGGHHVPVARAALLSSGTIRGAQEADLAAPGPRSGRAGRSATAAVLRPAARRAPPAGRARRPVATARMQRRPGTATGPRIASWPSPGKAPTARASSWR